MSTTKNVMISWKELVISHTTQKRPSFGPRMACPFTVCPRRDTMAVVLETRARESLVPRGQLMKTASLITASLFGLVCVAAMVFAGADKAKPQAEGEQEREVKEAEVPAPAL